MSQSFSKLFSSYKLGNITLQNRIVMAPMTRNRAIGNIPNDLMAEYYGARAGAGLIITEGTSPSPNGLGYARIPGIYSDVQVAGWKKVTDAVHTGGGHIFVQMMHTGRITHPLNLTENAEVVGASAIAASNTPMWTDQEGMKDLPVPKEIATTDIPDLVEEFVQAAKFAMVAGFDGVELHAANGYLLEQFLNTASNQRSDEYGGSIKNRNRLVLEVVSAVANAIGKEKTAIRLSPFGVNGEMVSDASTIEQYAQLAEDLNKTGIVYLHVVDHSALGAPAVPQAVKDAIRKNYTGTIIISGGYNARSAEADLEAGKGELVAFGRPFIANPDFVERIRSAAELATPDATTFYTPGEKGYTDYPVLS